MLSVYSDVNFKIESEVNTYVHLQLADNEENPPAFWRKQEGNYPNLSVLAKCYLSISASSVPVEAMFSTCGLILHSKRSSMAPHRANMVSVIHDNYTLSSIQHHGMLLLLCPQKRAQINFSNIGLISR